MSQTKSKRDLVLEATVVIGIVGILFAAMFVPMPELIRFTVAIPTMLIFCFIGFAWILSKNLETKSSASQRNNRLRVGTPREIINVLRVKKWRAISLVLLFFGTSWCVRATDIIVGQIPIFLASTTLTASVLSFLWLCLVPRDNIQQTAQQDDAETNAHDATLPM